MKISRNRDINSSFPIFKCLWTKRFRIRNIIISMKQRSIIVASKHRINETKILKCSLMGPIKNLQVKKGVLNIALAITALHIWAKSLFFIDLFQSDTSKDDKIKIISWHRVTYLFNLFVFLDVKSFYLSFRLHLLGARWCVSLWPFHGISTKIFIMNESCVTKEGDRHIQKCSYAMTNSKSCRI